MSASPDSPNGPEIGGSGRPVGDTAADRNRRPVGRAAPSMSPVLVGLGGGSDGEGLRPPYGGQFLIGSGAPSRVFVPEQRSAEARLVGRSMEEFVEREVKPVNDRLEAQEDGLMPSLMRRAGTLGLLAGGVPTAYGGLGLPKTTLALLAEKSASNLSFAISISVHAGVGTLPILLFGSDALKERYLPRLASGELLAAFALSEGNSGSDALAAQARAVPVQDEAGPGYYTIDGTKLWVTNGRFANVVTVFAQVEGAGFSAILVERSTELAPTPSPLQGKGPTGHLNTMPFAPGVIVGPEENKLGLKGSSTCRLTFNGAQVPARNMIGEVGRGHKPALYALNVGRFNIGVIALGAAKRSLEVAVGYAKERRQSGRAIASFGLVQHKLAEMAIRTFALESMTYRIAGYWDDAIATGGSLEAVYEEYAIECAILKFFGTEVMDYAADECLQIHGGFGYSEDFSPAQTYRDARVFRIFEGTNEINRLTVMDQIRRRVQRGRLPIGKDREESLASINDRATHSDRNAAEAGLRTAAWVLASHLIEMTNPPQEAACAVGDICAHLFAIESMWLRSIRAIDSAGYELGFAAANAYADVARSDGAEFARTAFGSLNLDDAGIVRVLSDRPIIDTVAIRRRIAEAVIDADGYPWRTC